MIEPFFQAKTVREQLKINIPKKTSDVEAIFTLAQRRLNHQ
jgi:hypothetical protein